MVTPRKAANTSARRVPPCHELSVADTMKRRQRPRFPAATVAYYGPDNRTTTKIVVGIIRAEGQQVEPLKRWVGSHVRSDPQVRSEIHTFLRAHEVRALVVSNGNMGCVHEEGEDFPVGSDCPFCPFWRGRQGSGSKPQTISGVVMALNEFFGEIAPPS